MNLAQECRRIRKEKGLTQQELADKAGVSFNTVSRFEKEHTGTTVQTAEKIFKTLGYEVVVEKIVEKEGQQDENCRNGCQRYQTI